jgi:hypothetical protein
MAAPSVWEEEELRLDGVDTGAKPVGRTPWQLFWVRFRGDKVALAALAFLILLILAAILAGPITRAVAHPPDAQFPSGLLPRLGRYADLTRDRRHARVPDPAAVALGADQLVPSGKD